MYRRTRTGKKSHIKTGCSLYAKATIIVNDTKLYPLCLRCVKARSKPSSKPHVKPSSKPHVKPSSKPSYKPHVKPSSKPITLPKPDLRDPWWITGSAQQHDIVFAFDLDWTLIKPKSGNVFPKHSSDWKWCFTNVVDKLRNLNGQIVIITNQRGLTKAKSKTTPGQFIDKMKSITDELDIPILWMVALETHHKPSLKLWSTAVDNGCIKKDAIINYIGDAGGRPKGWSKGKKADFSISDMHFAHCLGALFRFPEEFFGGCNLSEHHRPELFGTTILPDISTYDLVVMIGSPGSGKSTISRMLSDTYGHIHLEQDVLKRKINKTAKDMLSKGESVVIDATHRTTKSRKLWIDMASSMFVNIAFVWVDTDKDLSLYLNSLRVSSVPRVAIYTYYKRLEEPIDAIIVSPLLTCVDEYLTIVVPLL